MKDYVPLPPSFSGTTAAVVGVGISNRPLVDLLLGEGAEVTVCDRKSREALGVFADELEAKGVTLRLGDGYLDSFDERYIFRAPGIRCDIPPFIEAQRRGSVLTSEMELFFERCPAGVTIVGVTGSSGKTTTTTVISMMLEKSGKSVFVGGNIGRPLLPLLPEMKDGDFAVVELSSFQLQTMLRSPDISVVTNISPNHLDYHRTMEEYINAKGAMLRYMRPGGRAVLNLADPLTAAMRAMVPAGVNLAGFAAGDGIADAFVTERDGVIYRGGTAVLKEADIRIPGHFNAENYMAAIAAVDGIVPDETVRAVAASFGGVAHRLELVCERGGVKYYNSSIDSSPSRTIATLGVFPGGERRLIVICGGYDKKLPYEPLAVPLCHAAKAVVLTGATGGAIRRAIEGCSVPENERPLLYDRASFDDAVATAVKIAREGDIVLLSPASASFDAFPNFEVRGERFRTLVQR